MKVLLFAVAFALFVDGSSAQTTPRYLVTQDTVPTYINDPGTIGMSILFDQVSVGSDVGLSIGTFLPGAVVAEHLHDGAAELLYVLSGELQVTIAGTTVNAGAGSAVYIPPNALHSAQVRSAIEPVKVVQVYSPGGAEQRFKAWRVE